jgi:hypothetical protein
MSVLTDSQPRLLLSPVNQAAPTLAIRPVPMRPAGCRLVQIARRAERKTADRVDRWRRATLLWRPDLNRGMLETWTAPLPPG